MHLSKDSTLLEILVHEFKIKNHGSGPQVLSEAKCSLKSVVGLLPEGQTNIDSCKEGKWDNKPYSLYMLLLNGCDYCLPKLPLMKGDTLVSTPLLHQTTELARQARDWL